MPEVSPSAHSALCPQTLTMGSVVSTRTYEKAS